MYMTITVKSKGGMLSRSSATELIIHKPIEQKEGVAYDNVCYV